MEVKHKNAFHNFFLAYHSPKHFIIAAIDCCVWLNVSCWCWLLHGVHYGFDTHLAPYYYFFNQTIDCCVTLDTILHHSISPFDCRVRIRSSYWLLCLLLLFLLHCKFCIIHIHRYKVYYIIRLLCIIVVFANIEHTSQMMTYHISHNFKHRCISPAYCTWPSSEWISEGPFDAQQLHWWPLCLCLWGN